MKSFARILSVFLSMLMVLYLVPAEVYSLKTSATELAIDKIVSADNVLSTANTEVTALGEDISKRTASSKTIRMSDGSYRLVQYANEVHYEKCGEWIEYDNSLSLSSSENAVLGGVSTTETPVFTTASNPGGLKFGQSTADKVLSFADGNKKLEMSINGASKNSTIVPQAQVTDAKPANKWEELITIENYSSSVMYSNVFNNAHIRYTTAGNQVKEDIIVFREADSYVYSFNFTLTGLEAEMQADGSIIFKDETTDEMMYYIPTGYMYDSDGDTSTAVSYSLTQTATGCTVTVTADAKWINSTERAFPVVIDPTIIRDNNFLYNYNEIRDIDAYGNVLGSSQWQYIRVGNVDGHNYSGYISLYAEDGEEEVGFVLPDASVITNAKLVLDVTEFAPTTVVSLYAIKEEWDHTSSTWTAPEVLEHVVDYKMIESATEPCELDFTSIAQTWGKTEEAETSFYKGFKLSCDDGVGHVEFASLNYSAADNNNVYKNYPYFVITYRDTKGLDGKWTYNSQSAGGAGTGHVNLFTGNLVFAHDDITTNGEILPLTVSHVYNSHQTAQQFTSTDNEFHTATYNMTVGNGFKLSIQETIVEKTIDNVKWYIYNDADGTELYFFKPTGKTEYISEDGLDLTITKSGGVYTMKDKVGNTKKFNSSGMLTEIADLHGNKKIITYSSGRINMVKHTTVANQTKTQLEFVYNDAGALRQIINTENPDEYVNFAYSTTPTGTANSNNAGYLRTVTHSKGAGSCTYEYFGGGRLKHAIDTATGTRILYQYNVTQNYSPEYAMVDSVTEYNSSDNRGQKIGFIYGAETTTVRTTGLNDIYEDDIEIGDNTPCDDLLTHYVFDDWGRTVSAYSTNFDKTEVYGASNAEYSPTEQGSKKNNTITKDSVSGVPAINLLKNHSVESDSEWRGYSSGTGFTSTHTPAEHFIGDYSYKLTTPSTKITGFAERRQSVTITEAGDYTLSAYVKLQISNVTTGFSLELGGVRSLKLKENTNPNIQGGWQRLSVTTYLEAGTHDVRVLLQTCTGTAYVDCLQLEKGTGASKYNLMENGAFIGNSNGWTLSMGASYLDGEIKLEGDIFHSVTASQTVKVNKPLNTTFVLSGWSKADSVALTDSYRKYGIRAILYYNNGESEDTWVNFCAENGQLQFASGAVVANEKEGRTSITSVKVELCYDNNANTAYFDNICLAMEPAQTYLYDDEGNLTSATNAEGNKIGAEYYDNQIDLKSYTSIIGETYTYEYNSKHMLTESTRIGATPITTTYAYDQYGNQTAEVVTNADGSLSVSAGATYDSYGKTLTATDSRGNVTTYAYNNYTELLQYVQTANNARTAYVYDNKDRITSIYNDIDRDGVKDTTEQFVSYTYNSKNQLTGIQTDNTLYTLTYDSFGNSSSVKTGNYTLATYEYNDKNGKLLGTTYGNGFTVTNVYDLLDRLVAVKYNDNVAYTVTYNGNGSVACITDVRSGRSTDYEYDSLGRLIRAEQYITSSGISLLKTENGYDTYGRASLSKYHLNGKTQGYEVSYKSNSNLLESFEAYISGAEWLNTEFAYDSLDRLTGKTVHSGEYEKQESYEYLTDGTSTTSLISKHTVDGVEYSYTYDSVGNITAVRKNGALKYSYSYDKLGQLIEAVIYSDTYSTDYLADIYIYNYDKSGNILSVTHTYGAGASNFDTVQYAYGDASWGDLLTSYNGTAITYDAIGNPLKWRNASMLEWSGRNLISFLNTNGEVYTYAYNADGIRTSKNYYNAGGNLIGTDEYIYDGTKLIAESRSGDWLYYFYDASGAIAGFSYNNTLYYFRKNLQGDVTGIYNAYGTLVVEYEYTPYGAILSTTGSMATTIGAINPFRYRGYYYDTETGFYYLQTRYYDPEAGRFLNADAFISTGQGILGNNMFAYCLNNPVNMIDIDGRDPIPQWATRIINGEGTEEDYMIAFIIDPSPWVGFARNRIDKAIELAYSKYHEYKYTIESFFPESLCPSVPEPQELALKYFLHKKHPWLKKSEPNIVQTTIGTYNVFRGPYLIIKGFALVAVPEPTMLTKLNGIKNITLGVVEFVKGIIQLAG